MSRLGFGIDGGGTRSRLCVFQWETGRELGRFTGGSTNQYSVGPQAALANIEALLRSAGIPLESLAGGCLGSAGLSRPGERKLYGDFFQKLLPGCPVYLCNDGEILLVGGLQSPQGYSLIGGTGSLALGRSADGRLVRAGGLGYMLGDEGSALWIGWQAINRSLRSREGRDLETGLLPLLAAHFHLARPEDFVAMMHQRFDKATIASAARLVLERADTDPLAGDIAAQAVKELTLLLGSVLRRLPLENPRAALSGGVIENSPWIQRRLLQSLKDAFPRLQTVLGAGDAVKGACLLARASAQANGREGLS